MLSTSSYRIPEDLPQEKAVAELWTLNKRVEMGKEDIEIVKRFHPLVRFNAVVITLVEQPLKVYGNNCCGIMCQGSQKPWGWSIDYWDFPPSGYVMLREGLTGKQAPFLSFHTIRDSFWFLCRVVEKRKIFSGEDYALKWVGQKTPNPATVDAFYRNMELVLQNEGWVKC